MDLIKKNAIAKKFLLQLLILLPVLNYAQNNTVSGIYKKYTVSQLQTDVIILRDALVKAHPGLFWYQPEKQFQEQYHQLYDSLKEPVTETDFYKMLKPFIGDIKCGHTNIQFSKTTLDYFMDTVKYLPLRIRLINHKVYIEENYTDESIVPGTEISSINGRAVELILQDMQPYSLKDGLNTEASEFRLRGMFNFLLILLYKETATYSLELLAPSGKELKVNVKGITDKEMELFRVDRAKKKNAKEYTPFRFKQLDSLNTALLAIDDFVAEGFDKFLKKSFKTIKQNKFENLIIDLRHSTGGEDEYGSLLYTYIAENKFNYYDHLEITIDDPDDSIFSYGKLPSFVKKAFQTNQLEKKDGGLYDLKKSLHPNLEHAPFNPNKNSFKKKVYVLIGQECFSATTEFCAIVHSNKRAKFIGQETGGCYCGNTSSDSFELTLPNTGLTVYIPLVKYYVAVNGCPYGRGIQPDYPIQQSIENFINGKDAEMDFTLDLIRNMKAQ